MSRTKGDVQRSRIPHLHRRRLWIAGLTVAAAAAFWFGGGLVAVLHGCVSRSLAERHYEAAEDTLKLIRNLQCANAETFFWEARLSRKLLRIAEASELLLKAKQAGFDTERLAAEAVLLQAQTGQISDIIRQLNAMIADPGEDGAEICEAYVNGALIAGVSEIAVQIIPVWKSDFPDDPQASCAHARLLEFQGRTPEAVAELRHSIEVSGTHWPARYALGRILLGQNTIEEALAQFEATAEMRDNAAPLYQKAKCLRALGRGDEALAILREVVSRPDEAIRKSFLRVGDSVRGLPVQLELGTLQSSRRNYEEAARWLNMVVENDPKNLDARYARAIALRELKQTEKADADFAEVNRVRMLLTEVDRLVDEINNSPNDPCLEKCYRVGELLLEHENSGRGEFWLRETLSRDPGYAPAHELLARYYDDLSKQEPGYGRLAEEHRHAADQARAKRESSSTGEVSRNPSPAPVPPDSAK